MVDSRDAIFISYATEDIDFALWLARKLTGISYKVWCDKFKLLGGEPYPADIDDAIRNRTFRFLTLVSRHSNLKPNPTKERTTALKLSNERGSKDFVIPLRVDDIPPSELNWMVSDLTFIDFSNGWRDGLQKLLKKLTSINAPKPIQDGMKLTAEEFIHDESISTQAETLCSNSLAFLEIPGTLKEFQTKAPLSNHEMSTMATRWPCYPVDGYTIISFQNPPPNVAEILGLTETNSVEWKKVEFLDDIPTRNIAKNLLLRTIYFKCLEKGLKLNEHGDLYFPSGLLSDGAIHYLGYGGRKTYVQIFGERRYKRIDPTTQVFTTRKFQYGVSPFFKIRDFSESEIKATLGIRLHIVEPEVELTARAINARRKKVCSGWWNHEWFNRHIAVMSFLSDGADKIVFGEGDSKVVLSTKLDEFTSPVGIKEATIGSVEIPMTEEESVLDEDEGDAN